MSIRLRSLCLALVFLLTIFAVCYLFLDRQLEGTLFGYRILSIMDNEERTLNEISKHLDIRYTVLSNIGYIQYHHEVLLTNTGKKAILAGEWSIFFSSLHIVRNIQPKGRKTNGISVRSKFAVHHVDGGHFKLTPTSEFQGLEPGESEAVRLKSSATAARCYIFPRWYVTSPGYKPKIIQSTNDETLSFVGDFDSPDVYKRNDHDYSKPYSPADRYLRYNVTDRGEAPLRILPTPVQSSFDESLTVDLSTSGWNVCSADEFSAEAGRFAGLVNLPLVPVKEPCPPSHVVKFVQGEVSGLPVSDEAYQIVIETDTPSVTILAGGSAGAFYATQTLQSMLESKRETPGFVLPSSEIKDAPRFGYRGLHIDVARNFIGVDDILNLIEAMAMYKLNKLHLHLTDDEGWRLEIPDLPELTDVGAVRGHTQNESTCLFPALGSGPFSEKPGSGFYSVADYKRILAVAAANHIEVIPEVDMPGHSHAAMKAMEARYYRLMQDGRISAATEFLLTDFNDESPAQSVQHFRNNAMNPCMPSTMRFVEKIIDTIIDFHSEIQPLRTMHIGGDEVAGNSWRDSPICEQFISKTEGFPYSHRDLQEHFMRQVTEIISRKKGLSAGVWEDGAMELSDNTPFDKKLLHDVDVIAYAWNNGWRSRNVERPHKLAAAGYKVVMAMATHLYFDHPQEPDPEEVGLFWATRYTDDKMVFDFLPEDLYGNAKLDYNSAPFTAEAIDEIRDSHLPLTNPENVIGMQAQLWSELVRDVSVAHSQLFPRLIAFAERAWHRATWETEEGRTSRRHRAEDWEEFANVVGHKELARLKNRQIRYRLPPPGFKLVDDVIHISSLYPGLQYKYRVVDNYGEASPWQLCENGQEMVIGPNTYEFVTSDGDRSSRVVKVKKEKAKHDKVW